MACKLTKEYVNKLIDKANSLIGFDFYEPVTTDKPNKKALSKLVKQLENTIEKLERNYG